MEWTPVPQVYDPLKAGSIDGTDDIPHDRGVIRAMDAKHKANKAVVGIPEHTIFVGRLSSNTDEDSLGYVFSDYGEIKKLRLVRDLVTGISRCYAFIEYFDEDCAYQAQRKADKTILDEKEIYVDFECGRCLKGWIPRRLGGGIGGKKESGQLRFGGKNRPFKKPFNINMEPVVKGNTFRDRLKVLEKSDQRNKRSDRSNTYTSREKSEDRGSQTQRDLYKHKDRQRESMSREKHHSSGSRDRSKSSSDRTYSSRSRKTREY